MKALKDCEWKVTIHESIIEHGYYFYAKSNEAGFLETSFPVEFYGRNHVRKAKAISTWREFAKLNGITNYKIED